MHAATIGTRAGSPRRPARPAGRPGITVFLVDNQELIRFGLRRALGSDGEFDIVGEAPTAMEAVTGVGETRPRVVITESRLPDDPVVDAARLLREAGFGGGIVVLSAQAADADILDAMHAGANAFVPKSAPVDDVVAAARYASAASAAFAAPGLAEVVQRRLTRQEHLLDDDQLQILWRLAVGSSVAAIAGQLFVSEQTVRRSITAIFAKLGVANRAQALMAASRLGLLADVRAAAYPTWVNPE